MDPEIYVFPRINSSSLKIAASTALFVLVFVVAALLIPSLPGPHLWVAIDRTVTVGSVVISLASLLDLLLGYGLFIYGSAFGLLSLVLFIANGVFEERYVMLRFFGEEYRAYMRRVRARYFTLAQGIVLALFLALNIAGLFFR